RLASCGHEVTVGSRDRARGEAVAGDLRVRWGDRIATLRGGSNLEAAGCPLVVIATVADAAVDTAAAFAGALAGKVVVAVANGMEKVGREFRPAMPLEGSLAAAIQAAAPDARVVAAFQHIPASELLDLDRALGADVLVAGNDDDAREDVLQV